MSDGTLKLNPALDEREYYAASRDCTDLLGRVQSYQELVVGSEKTPIPAWSRAEIMAQRNVVVLCGYVMRLTQWFLAQMHSTSGDMTPIVDAKEVLRHIMSPPYVISDLADMSKAFQQMAADYEKIRDRIMRMEKITRH